jgi:hypothetical protein
MHSGACVSVHRWRLDTRRHTEALARMRLSSSCHPSCQMQGISSSQAIDGLACMQCSTGAHTFDPVCSFQTVRTRLSLATGEGLELR